MTNTHNINTLIFDFDGTLADTLPLAYYSFQVVFKKYDQLDYTDEDVKNMFGPTEPDMLRKHLKSSNIQDAIDLYFQTYTEYHEDLVIENSNVTQMLTALKDKGYKLAIVTGKSRQSLELSLSFLDMDYLFDCKISGDDVDKAKPDPEGVLKTMKILNVDKSEALFIGDSDGDILAGQQAGVQTIGAHWLPNIQSTTFSVVPNQTFKTTEEFLQAWSLL